MSIKEILGTMLLTIAVGLSGCGKGKPEVENSNMNNMKNPVSQTISFKGINYNAGIDYNHCGEGSEIDTSEFLSDLKNIKDMNCNSIRLYGSHNDKLFRYTKIAQKNDLIVWVSPRYIGEDKDATLEKILKLSKQLNKIHKKDSLFLIIGNEFSTDMKGICPGDSYMERAKNHSKRDKRSLEITLRELATKVRKNFKGKIAYAALEGENVPFELFDYIGLNHYWDLKNSRRYAQRLKELSKKYGKKIIITEFGTCGYKGASYLGGLAYYPIQEMKLHKKPLINVLVIPDDSEQVRALKRGFREFEKTDVEGTFIFDYAEKWKKSSPKKGENMDLGSFGVMRSNKNGTLEPKPAFYFIRDYYGDE